MRLFLDVGERVDFFLSLSFFIAAICLANYLYFLIQLECPGRDKSNFDLDFEK